MNLGSNTLIPIYDNEDSVCGIIYNDEPYYFQKNLQGDIVGIVDKDAKVVAKYSYDAWGVCTVTSDNSNVGIANVNLSKIKTGKVSAIRFSTLNAICDALDCQPGDILEFQKDTQED